MASTKLTLSVEDAFVDKAKRYAAKHKTSLSKLFSEILSEKIATDQTPPEDDAFLEKLNTIEISDKIRSLTGVLKVDIPAEADLKKLAREAKYEYLEKKYGL